MLKCSLLFVFLVTGVVGTAQRSEDRFQTGRVDAGTRPSNLMRAPYHPPSPPVAQYPLTHRISEDSRRNLSNKQENKGRIDWNFTTNDRGTAGSDPEFQTKPPYPSQTYDTQANQDSFQTKGRNQVKPQVSQRYDPEYDMKTYMENPDKIYFATRRPVYSTEAPYPYEVSRTPLQPQVVYQPVMALSPQAPASYVPYFAPTEPPPNVASDVSKGVAKLALSLDSVLPQWTNRLFSPASIGAALSLLLLGSRGRTGHEISNLLGVKDATTLERTEEIHKELGKVYGKLSNGEDFIGTQLLVACGLFPSKGAMIEKKYSHLARSVYKSEVLPQDFMNRERESRSNINRWVASKTSGRIPMLLSEPIDPDTSMIIVNALYFNGEWKHPFIQEATGPREFYPSEKETIKVPMMVNAAEAYYYHDKSRSLQVLGMPYKGDDVIMYIFFPQDNFQNFVSSLTPNMVHELINSTKLHETVIYTVPKMKLESHLKLRLPLEKLGVRTVFSPQASLQDIGPDVRVSEIYHQVEIEVTETGTVGSAATSVSLTRDGGTPMVRVEKPFVFFIYHAPSSSIIFWGSVLRPTPHPN